MKRATSKRLWVSAVCLAVFATVPSAGAQPRWFKGNTHAHTLNSDGDSTPEEVVRWYREHEYNFLVLSDHNFLTSVDGLNAVHGAEDKFLLIPGEEVSDLFEKKPLHINGLNLHQQVEPQGGTSVTEVLQRNVDEIRTHQGVPHINHPNYGWAISPDDLQKVHNYRLFEIFNGHPAVNNLGGVDKPGLEETWDLLLSSGKIVFGIAVDDAHHFKQPFNATASLPGRGWVMVRAERLTAEAILSAMERGDFYASTGVELVDYSFDSSQIQLHIKPFPAGAEYRTQLVGSGGKLLAESGSIKTSFQIPTEEPYVRVRILDSNGRTAWLQPIFRAP